MYRYDAFISYRHVEPVTGVDQYSGAVQISDRHLLTPCRGISLVRC